MNKNILHWVNLCILALNFIMQFKKYILMVWFLMVYKLIYEYYVSYISEEIAKRRQIGIDHHINKFINWKFVLISTWSWPILLVHLLSNRIPWDRIKAKFSSIM